MVKCAPQLLLRRLPVLLGFVLGGGALASAQAATLGDIYVATGAEQGLVLSNVPGDDGQFSVLLVAPVEPAPVLAPAPRGAQPTTAPKATLMEKVRRFEPWVAQAAREAQVDARLLHAVVATESAYNSAAVSPKGAMGLMQLMPATARRYGVQDSFDVAQNLRGGARYLADLLRMFGNDTALALAAYNAGENAVLRHGSHVPPFAETLAYVPKVLGLYRQISALPL